MPKTTEVKMQNTLSRCLLVVVLIILGGGCATIELQLQDVEVKPVSKYTLFQEKQGLQISLDPFLERDRVMKVFGTDLLSKGIFPVLVVANNKSKEDIFLLDKRYSSVGITSDEMAGIGGATVLAEMGALLFTPAIIGLPLVIGLDFLSYKSSQQAKIIMQNMSKKELLDKTIFPGDLHYGFLYFKLKDMEAIKKAKIIQLKAKNPRSEEEVTFIFNIKPTKKEMENGS
jgi:hypothetical protein